VALRPHLSQGAKRLRPRRSCLPRTYLKSPNASDGISDVNGFTNAVTALSMMFPTPYRDFPYPYGADAKKRPVPRKLCPRLIGRMPECLEVHGCTRKTVWAIRTLVYKESSTYLGNFDGELTLLVSKGVSVLNSAFKFENSNTASSRFFNPV